MSDFICGANEADFHFTGVNWGRDLPEPDVVADIRNVVAGDPSPDGKGVLAIQRGIEVGHVFCLGTKYSEAMNATFLDEDGKPQLLQMGCYGIGVTRIARRGDRAEPRRARHHLARRDRAVRRGDLPDRLRPQRRRCKAAADALHDELRGAGVDVMLDDRGERPGAMFADWELIGVPHRVVISDRGLKEGQVEYQGRRDAAADHACRAAEVAGLREGQAGGMSGGSRAAGASGAALPLARCGAALLARPRPHGRRADRGAAGRLGALRAVGGHRRAARRRKPTFDHTDDAPGLPALARRR